MASIAHHTTASLLFALVLMCAYAGAPAAFADDAHSKVADERQMATPQALTLEGMTPIGADQVRDGIYAIDAKSSSSFFSISKAVLTVNNSSMTADITVRSGSYPLVFMGTASEAAAAPESDYIEYNKEAETFTVPVAALDEELDCAAYSKRKKMWYGRTLMFYAASLPEGALATNTPVYGDPVENKSSDQPNRSASGGAEAVGVDMPDGEYSIEVNMTGGSGRAQVSSPTWLVMQDGRAYARLLWSSSYYDYMIVDGETYYNQTTDGSNSTFLIPITAMDDEIDVIADTTAMGDPVEIEYHLTFYSDTIGEKELIPQEAAIRVLELALIIIVVGGVLNHVLKKRRKC